MAAGPTNPFDEPPPEQRGMSGTTKVLLGFGIGCGVLLLLCCGVFGIGGYFVGQYAQQSFTNEPSEVRAIADGIAEINVPEELKPKGAIDPRVPFTGERLMTWVFFTNEDNNDFLILAEFGSALSDQSDDLEREVRNSMREDGTMDNEDVDVLDSETYETKIHGEDATFQVARVEGRDSGNEYWEVTGQFTGDAGPAILILRLSADDYTKDQAIDIIKSME